MDNIRRSSSRGRRAPSTDGFIGGPMPRRPKSAPRQRPMGRQRTGVNSRRSPIGNLKKSEGFYPSRSRTIDPADVKQNYQNMPEPTPAKQAHEKPSRGRKQRKKTKAHKPKRHIFRKALSTAMILILVSGGYLFGKGYLNLYKVFQGGGNAVALNDNVDPSTLNGEGDGRVNVLLLGRGGAGHDGADLTDTMIVASIDPINKKAALLSIPRDLYVPTENYGAMKINQIFFTGKTQDVREGEKPNEAGIRFLKDTLTDVIGIPIHYHVSVDFTGFKQAVNTVGGVTIDVPEELAVYEYYPESGYVLDVEAGEEKFDGDRALAFSRTRKTSPRGDFDRSERQRLMMIALKDKVFSLGTFSNPVTISNLLDDLGNHVSSNFSIEEVLRVYEIVQEIPNSEIASVGLADGPNSFVTTSNIGGLSVVVPRAGTFDYSEIQSFVRNALRDGFLASEDAYIDVYNGTFIGGLAGRTAEQLESFGYSVGTVADAPNKGVAETVLVDLTGGEKKYTKAYLERRFGVTAGSSIPDGEIQAGDADFVIILGQNEESRLEN